MVFFYLTQWFYKQIVVVIIDIGKEIVIRYLFLIKNSKSSFFTIVNPNILNSKKNIKKVLFEPKHFEIYK